MMSGCKKEASPGSKLIIQSYLYANKRFDTLRIAEFVAGDIPFFSRPVIHADVVIETPENSFRLTDLQGHSGIYYYSGSDFIIKPGTSYTLTVKYNNYVIIAQASIPAKSSEPILLNDTIIVTNTVTSKNIDQSFATLKWNQVTDYSFIISDYEEKDTLPIDIYSSINSSYVPYYFQRPFNGNSVTMQMYDFKYYGSYNILICQVTDDFMKLFDEPTGTQVPTLIQDNIRGGYGIFTGVYCDTVKLKVLKEQP